MGLYDSVKTIKGIGPKKAVALEKLGIQTVGDLLSFYPRDYEDRRNGKVIAQLCDGEMALVRGTIKSITKGSTRVKRKQSIKILIEDATGSMEIVFFHGAYLEKTLSKGIEYEFFGKVSRNYGKTSMLHPDFSKYEKEKAMTILPVYPLTYGISQNEMRKWQEMIRSEIEELEDYLPQEILEKNRLCNLSYATFHIHFPQDSQKIKEAKYRLIFDELFLLQIGLRSLRNQTVGKGKGIIFSSQVQMEEFTKSFPYALTGAQCRVLDEINKDMESEKAMNRLVQGDVGSGKTAVAAAAIYKAVKSGFQCVMMAPTEILARQHYDGLQRDFHAYGIRVGFLSGSVTAKEKKAILQKLEEGEVDLLIGTHAVVQPNVKFSNLGLVITDEQHRFGVNQRILLSQKGKNPDILVMTATPIPRTLAVILYGDLDISLIDEMPPGRQSIVTKAINEKERKAAYDFLRMELEKGTQAYIVAPLIEDSENLDAKSAVGLYEELVNQFTELQVTLLHGAMKQKEKDAVMEDFYKGRIHILVSTVVIEVGINVPNATIMIIENAERFGLAQLHQLRGRVGRGSQQSYCMLITNAKTDIAGQRAEIMTSTNDGFIIAEKDLELRGPGEFFGIRQHGLPELRLADLVKHVKILQITKQEVNLVLEQDPLLEHKSNEKLRMKIEKTFENIENISI